MQLRVEGQTRLHLDMEDTADLRGSGEHTLHLSFHHLGTTVFLDGYEVFSSATNACPTSLLSSGDAVSDLQFYTTAIDPCPLPPDSTSQAQQGGEETIYTLPSRTALPTPAVQFAASYLSAPDLKRIRNLSTATVWLQFRVRGPRQFGTIFAASAHPHPASPAGSAETTTTPTPQAAPAEQTMQVSIDHCGITYRVKVADTWHTVFAPGSWDDGNWHDLAIRASRGAIDIYVDGFQYAHEPGQFFFASTDIDAFHLGMDSRGVRLMGEVRRGGIYPQALNDSQLKALSQVTPAPTVCLFDRGVAGAASYRIPTLLTTANGVVIAGADQRLDNSNDAPNHIRFVIRRSLDGGYTWEPMQTVLALEEGSAVTDPCLVLDIDSQRVHALIDYFPQGVGLPNSEAGLGSNEPGPQAAPTSYILHLYSDDDGATWSQPTMLNHQLKAQWMTFLGVCPGRGIALQRGKYRGRLIVPYYCTSDTGKHYSAGVFYSDDGGQTWRRGKSVNPDPQGLANDEHSVSETTAVELEDGRVRVFMRNQHPLGLVASAVSEDGGQTWGSVTHLLGVPEVFSLPSAVNWEANGKEVIAFGNASRMLPYRGCGTIRLSADGGQTWPVSRCFNPYHFVYLCLEVLPNADLGLLWERETTGVYFSRLPRTWFHFDRKNLP
ncbi:MAG: sialidase family protein [Actinomycetaceae bacterium]|nr:sialidase family protein [Actinomycetaceae bacterium]